MAGDSRSMLLPGEAGELDVGGTACQVSARRTGRRRDGSPRSPLGSPRTRYRTPSPPPTKSCDRGAVDTPADSQRLATCRSPRSASRPRARAPAIRESARTPPPVPKRIFQTPLCVGAASNGGATTPPLLGCRRTKQPLIREALLLNSAAQVQDALKQDLDAAWMPLYEFGAEPPLCLAVRFCCSKEVVRLLLAYGANANAMDRHGYSALTLLSIRRYGGGIVLKEEEPQDRWEPPDHWAQLGFHSFVDMSLPHVVTGPSFSRLDVDDSCSDEANACSLAGLLLAAGADPEREDGKGNTAYKVATASGFKKLGCLWQHYSAVQALCVISRAGSAQCGAFTRLHSSLVFSIFRMLLPSDVLRRVVDTTPI